MMATISSPADTPPQSLRSREAVALPSIPPIISAMARQRKGSKSME